MRLPLARLPLPQMTLAELGADSSPAGSSCESTDPHMPRWLSPGDMSFMAAATNAVSAANNVNSQLNSITVELQGSVDNMHAAIQDARGVALIDSKVDVAQVS